MNARQNSSQVQRVRTGWALLLALGLFGTACTAASADHSTKQLGDSLELGHTADYYWQELERRGYQVTSVNYDDSDYVEYEIVRDGESFEVQIDLDENRRARGVEVVGNTWLADETAEVLDKPAAAAPVSPTTAPAPVRPYEARPDVRHEVVVAAGTPITVSLVNAVSTATATVGQQVEFRVVEPVSLGNDVAIPAGSVFYGTVVMVEKAERPQKAGKLDISLTELGVHGRRLDVQAAFVASGKGSLKDDARDIGIGAAVGAIVGAIVDGGKGAIAGIVIGGGGVFLATKGEDVEMPAGTRLQIELRQPVTVPLDS